jgi:hypothetical protein
MDRSGKLLTAALLRPLNLIAPGAGLLFALSPYGPWWTFPVSFVPYAIMVMLNLRDPEFVRRAVRDEEDAATGEAIDWKEALAGFGSGELKAPLQRIAASEQ